MLNKAILMGRFTRDPELRYTQNNTPVASFTLAMDRPNSWGDGKERQADFIDIVAWNHTAEFVSKWFAKGMMAIVVGRIQSRRWQDRSGNNRVSIEVVADEVQFGETKRAREQAGGQMASATPMPPSAPMHMGGNDFEEIVDDGEVPF